MVLHAVLHEVLHVVAFLDTSEHLRQQLDTFAHFVVFLDIGDTDQPH